MESKQDSLHLSPPHLAIEPRPLLRNLQSTPVSIPRLRARIWHRNRGRNRSSIHHVLCPVPEPAPPGPEEMHATKPSQQASRSQQQASSSLWNQQQPICSIPRRPYAGRLPCRGNLNDDPCYIAVMHISTQSQTGRFDFGYVATTRCGRTDEAIVMDDMGNGHYLLKNHDSPFVGAGRVSPQAGLT